MYYGFTKKPTTKDLYQKFSNKYLAFYIIALVDACIIQQFNVRCRRMNGLRILRKSTKIFQRTEQVNQTKAKSNHNQL